MTMLNLTPDELLTTTRSVRKRLDFSRPVEMDVIRECLELAVQAPTGGNRQMWHFVVVTDAEKRRGIAELYRSGWAASYGPGSAGSNTQQPAASPEQTRTQERVLSSAQYLAEHFHEVPVYVLPCMRGRFEGASSQMQAGAWGSMLPAAWSFMLAARARGLGTVWTTLHLRHEKEAAELLGIPYEKVTQAALIPVAYTLGTDFKAGSRKPLDDILHLNQW